MPPINCAMAKPWVVEQPSDDILLDLDDSRLISKGKSIIGYPPQKPSSGIHLGCPAPGMQRGGPRVRSSQLN